MVTTAYGSGAEPPQDGAGTGRAPDDNDRVSRVTAGEAAAPGEHASVLRRPIALVIDWWSSWLVAYLLFAGHPLATLGVFALQCVVLLAATGQSFGHRILGIRVVVDPRLVAAASRPGGRSAAGVAGAAGFQQGGIGLLRALTRTALLCLILPAVIWDEAGRGLHDRAAGTTIVRAGVA